MVLNVISLGRLTKVSQKVKTFWSNVDVNFKRFYVNIPKLSPQEVFRKNLF